MLLQTILIYTAYILIFLLTTLYIYYKHVYNYWKRQNIPFIKPTIPFGNVAEIMLSKKCFTKGFHDLYQEFNRRSVALGGIYFFNKPSLLVLDPELIKCVLTKDFAHFHDRTVYHDDSDPLSNHLLALTGAKWRSLRSKITPTFTSRKMKVIFQTVAACSHELEDIIEEHVLMKKPLDLRDLFARLTTDIIGSCAFGIDCNSLKDPDNEFRKVGSQVFQFKFRESLLNMIAAMCPSFLKFFKIPITNPKVTEFYINILKQTIEYREKNNVTRKDFLDLMIRLKNKQPIWDDLSDASVLEGITFNELAAQCFIFLGAGFETTASTLNLCFYELCENQQIQNKVRDEVQNTLKNYNDELTYEAVMEMKYLSKVVDEVLRKYPIISVMGRVCTVDYLVPNTDFKIKKGTDVLISSMGLQRDPKYYPDPEKFDPERFSEEEKAKRHPFTYLPFGEGPRNCIAMRFALLQVKLILAAVIQKYKFDLDPKTKTPIKYDPKNFFLTPVDIIWIQPSKINQ